MIAAKRFWSEVRVVPQDGGFGVALDARPLRTPAQALLLVPTARLAEAVAGEWRAINGEIRPETLPFTRAVNVAIDRVSRETAPVIDQLARYGDADLLCYRAAEPEALRRRQEAGWDQVLDWAAGTLDAPLRTTVGVVYVPQPAQSLAALRVAVAELGPFELTALHELVTLSGSLTLGLAVRRGARSAEAAWSLSRIDEIWQIEQWGADADAEAADALKRADFLRAAELLEMLAV